MFDVIRVADDRLNLTIGGKLDSDEAAQLIAALFRHSTGIRQGRMLIDIDGFDLPTFGGLKVELARLPDLWHLSRQFAHAALLADETWLRGLGNVESKLMPGLVIKSFRKDQRYHAETWLQSVMHDAERLIPRNDT
ncbi:MAG: hypothetical protein RLZZ227_2014 [Pseudomonadota bacterium]|jgi:hypothetical protein